MDLVNRSGKSGLTMHVVANMDPALALHEVPAYVRRVDALGYDALHVAETIHDPFMVSLLALEHTTSLRVRTSVALAFPRSPMVVAYAAWDLAHFSGGRFDLGLGTQIRQNIEERYSAPYGDPVARMRDYIGSLRAIFASFQTGEPLSFESEHYRFTRLQPYFNPGPLDVEAPPIWLGGVNAKMCRLAGELADGFITHPTNSDAAYLEEICIPNLEAGASGAGRSSADIEVIAGAPLVTGASHTEMTAERERQRRSFAFLFSTPAYRRSLERHGWTDIGERLRTMADDGRWEDMASHITDELLDALVLQATYDDLPEAIERRYGDLVDGVLMAPPHDVGGDERFADALQTVKKATGSPGSRARLVPLRPAEGRDHGR